MNLRRAVALLGLLILPACLDPIVGTECATGYSPCRGICVATGACTALDAASEADAGILSAFDGGGMDEKGAFDSANSETGAEAKAITDTQAADGAWVDSPTVGDVPAPDDAQMQDDAPAMDDAPALDDTVPTPINALDACPDCVDSDNASESGNMVDGGIDDADDSVAVDTALVCTDPQVICNDQCVDESADPENCGECNNLCASGVCIDGGCLVCATEESVCGRQCVDLSRDPDNCGVCGNSCGSGLCNNGQCEAAGTGRAIVIGHDYLKNRPAMNRILGNAVFLWPVNPVRLLVYEGDANATAIAGADAAIAQVASATGRQAVRTSTGASDVSTLLASTDVFLIYGQERASDTTLGQLGLAWKDALLTFVNAGGTVVLLDGVYENNGTSQILAQAGLFQIARSVSTTGDVCKVVSHGDALATGLPRTYLCETNSTSFVVTDSSATVTPVVVVVEDSELTVVVHKIF